MAKGVLIDGSIVAAGLHPAVDWKAAGLLLGIVLIRHLADIIRAWQGR